MSNKSVGSVLDTLNAAASSIGDAAERIQVKASELGEQASAFGHDAVHAIDARRKTAASGLDSVGQFAHQAGDKVEATATYVRDTKVRDMFSDITAYVKVHPTQAIVGAVVLGFLAGRMLRRN